MSRRDAIAALMMGHTMEDRRGDDALPYWGAQLSREHEQSRWDHAFDNVRPMIDLKDYLNSETETELSKKLGTRGDKVGK